MITIIEAASIFVSIVSLIWVFIVIWLWKVYLPQKIDEGGRKVETTIEKKLPQMVEKSIPYVRTAIKEELATLDIKKEFNKILPDIKDALQEEFGSLDINKILEDNGPAIITMVLDELFIKLATEDEKEREKVLQLIAIIVSAAIGYIHTNPEIKKILWGYMSKLKEEIKKDMESYLSFIKDKAAEYGVDIDMDKKSIAVDPDALTNRIEAKIYAAADAWLDRLIAGKPKP